VRREIYADHAATTRVAPEVLAAMEPFFGDAFGNASSVHARGEAARDAIEQARGQVAALLGAASEEIVFTATGSEANNLALQGAMAAAPPERRRLVVSAIEHPSVLVTARALESQGHPLTIVPVTPEGVVDLVALGAALGPDVALVSVMWANNEIGTIQPTPEIAQLAHGAGARFHTDAVQAAGKLDLTGATAHADFLTIAGHKFHGPLGAAALYVRRRARIHPQIHGGHQERSRRAGTENLPAIVGLGAAATLAQARLAAGDPERIAALTARLVDGLLAGVPGTRLHGARAARVPGIANLGFDGVDGEAVLHELDTLGITVSTGSACSAGEPGPSPVLLALGLRPEDAHASVRFSLGGSIQDDDVTRLLAEVPPVIERLRALARSA
jgi:cysteine sulfinate desulfinase/cysteine desulfurase-like protein